MVPLYLQRLGLDQSADERAVRRAYARELKGIDQEADPVGFQSLREAYDAALLWAKQQKDLAPAPVVATPTTAYGQTQVVPQFVTRPAPPIAPQPAMLQTLVDAEADAAATFDIFMAQFHAACNRKNSQMDEKSWRAALEQCLLDERLVNIAAREGFERRLACLLAEGWKPGHAVLFVVAAKVFDWSGDRRHLLAFGHPGHVIDRALDERAIFDSQPAEVRERQRRLIARLRDDSKPSYGELMSDLTTLLLLVERFPVWLRLITNLEQLQRWRECDQEVPAWRRKLSFKNKALAKATPASAKPAKTSSHAWRYVFGFIVVINAMRFFGSIGGPSEPPPIHLSTQPSQYALPSQAPARPPATTSQIDLALRSGRPVPPPVPKKALAALVRKAPTAETCKEVAKMAYDYGVGTLLQDADLGEGFDRQIIACVANKHWPRPADDPALRQALGREKSRIEIDTKKTQLELSTQRLLGSVRPSRPISNPSMPPDTGTGKYPLDYKDPEN
jgi:hypothetical protein